jgi:hypothetical protein
MTNRPAAAAKRKPLTKAEQRRRFEETARELGCDEGQALDHAFSKIVPPKVPSKDSEPPRSR